ncbi:MAG: hypothetical protein ACXQS5_07295 [Candidatus Methanospirareceae archaeon]
MIGVWSSDGMVDIVGVTISKNGVSIRLTYKQWAHIIESHDQEFPRN